MWLRSVTSALQSSHSQKHVRLVHCVAVRAIAVALIDLDCSIGTCNLDFSSDSGEHIGANGTVNSRQQQSDVTSCLIINNDFMINDSDFPNCSTQSQTKSEQRVPLIKGVK